jgi:hypothetical protein
MPMATVIFLLLLLLLLMMMMMMTMLGEQRVVVPIELFCVSVRRQGAAGW